MTEYAVKEIGHQWIVYADRLSIGACADEDLALKLIAEDSAAKSATRKSTVHGDRASKNPPGVNRRPCRASFIAGILFGPPVGLASECDEVRLAFPDLVPSQHHERAAVLARRILSGVQWVEQEFLVAGHSVLSPGLFQPERWLLVDPLRPPRRQKAAGREPDGRSTTLGRPLVNSGFAAMSSSANRLCELGGFSEGVSEALSFVFSSHVLECSAIHLAASCSVMKPLITSVSPSGHRISIPQPVPGFFRAPKVGRCSNIPSSMNRWRPVQASHPDTIKLRNSPNAGPGSAGCHRRPIGAS